MSTSTSKSNECTALAAGVVIGDQEFVICLRDGRRVAVPFRCFPRLAYASSEQRAHFEVYANGRMLHWPEIDEDIEVAHILEGRMAVKEQRIEKSVAESEETYGGRAGKSPLERAKAFYAQKEYDCCAFMLCKELEHMLKAYLPPCEQRDRNYNELDLAGLISKAKARASGDAREMLAKLDVDRRHILNPLAHDDHRNTYSEEIRSALKDVEILKEWLK